MAKSKRGGRLVTSTTPPQLFTQQKRNTTETKYFGLRRDSALSDITAPDKALGEVLRDIQDPAEASTLGIFTSNDLQIIDAITTYDLKKEDFEILENSSINAEDAETGRLVPLINPRQRLSDRIKQFEGFAGRGTVYQGQGTVLFKYLVEDDNYNHTMPPPFYTEEITSTAENAPDYIPTQEQIASTHRVGFVKNGEFIPSKENEWWWNGEYEYEFRERAQYGDESSTALSDPKYPIIRDGNIKFSQIYPDGIETKYNWGLRFDTWFKINFNENPGDAQKYMRWAVQVNGQIRIDYFDKTGYNSDGAIQGSWKTALDTTDSSTYYVQQSKEHPTSTKVGNRIYYLQGGPSTSLGAGNGTLPTQRTPEDGGALDIEATYTDRESNSVGKFDDDYVPVVIRFWYGKPNPVVSDPLTSGPLGEATFVIDMLDSSVAEADLPKWNDYSAEIRLTYVEIEGGWSVDTSISSTEDNFVNFNSQFEVVSHGILGELTKPATVSQYITPEGFPIIAQKSVSGGTTYVTFSIPGLTPSDGEKVWVVAKNRPFSVTPPGANRVVRELWQEYLFNPDTFGEYQSTQDLLEGVGDNYVEPDPKKSPFEENPNYYKAKYAALPTLNTYTSTRYDGTLLNRITELNTERDYDYNHDKLLLIGRQKKGTISEIGTTPPFRGRDLVAEEVRTPAENYSFIRVEKNAAGRGGNVVINAFPANTLSVFATSETAQFAKFLHMGDNTQTFTDASKQNVSELVPSALPSNANFGSTARLRYEIINGSGRLVYGTWNGSAFTPDTTGVIAQLSFGTGTTRSHESKSALLVEFTKPGGTEYFPYNFISLIRDSKESEEVTVETGGTTIVSSELFSNGGAAANNSQYIGTEIIFPDDVTTYRVSAYNASTETVTITPAKTAGEYENVQIWYNHLSLSGALPDRVTNASGEDVITSSVLPDTADGRLIQISYVFNSAYQFTRVDNGSGLSFGEVLYAKRSASPTPAFPFTINDSELPASPGDIALPFGYDNTPFASDPGLGGLCYPPYSVQNVEFRATELNDSELDSAPVGDYDVWWGGRNVNVLDLGQKSLTITKKLLLDFDPDDRPSLVSNLTTEQIPLFTGEEYSYKLPIELNVELPDAPVSNPNLYKDVIVHSNNKPVKDRFLLFLKETNNSLSVLSPTNPNW
jgi:hypothetical protein